MAGEFCVYVPTIKRKKSILYEDLYTYTGKDHALTNLLYAISLTDEMRSRFDKSEFNGQGEIQFKAFKDKANLDRLISAKLRLVDERRNIGAINAAGDEIAYDDPDTIKDRVLDYNDTHDEFHAKINFRDGKYYIDLDITDASNYKTNVILRELDAKFQAFNAYLRKVGIDPAWSKEARERYFNFRNYRTLKSVVRSFFDSPAPFENMSSLKVEILLEILSHVPMASPLLGRIRNRFADDTIDAIKTISAGESLTVHDAEYWTDRINDLFDLADRALSAIDIDDLNEEEKNAADALPESGETFLDVPLVTVDDILEDLDDRFHIKHELISDAGGRVDSLSEAAKRFMTLQRRRYIIMRDVEHVSDKWELGRQSRRIDALQKLIDSGDYVNSIASFLSSVHEDFESLSKDLKALEEELESSPENELGQLNDWSRVIREAIRYVKAYGSVVRDLKNTENLDIDQDVPEELLRNIERAASSLSDVIDNVDKVSRRLQFSVVYMFLQRYWGPEDVKIVNGRAVSLTDILRTLSNDVNEIEKLFFSMNESTDEALGLFYEAVKTQNRERDAQIRKAEFLIRSATEALYRGGGDMSSIFIKDSEGKIYRYMKSELDYAKYFEAKRAYRQQKRNEGLRGKKLVEAMREWEDENLEDRFPFEEEENKKEYVKYMQEYFKELYDADISEEEILGDFVPYVKMPKVDTYGVTDARSMGLNAAEREYYLRMIALRTVVTNGIFNSGDDLFRVIPIEANVSENPVDKIKRAAEVFSAAYTREDDDLFGDTFEDMLAGNNIRTAMVTLEGLEYMQLPLFFKHSIDKGKTVSMDFSRAMLTMTGAAINYLTMSDAIDALMLAQEYLTNERGFDKQDGPLTKILNVMRQGSETRASVVKDDIAASRSAKQVEQFSLSNIFNQRKNPSWEIEMFGRRVSFNEAVDTVTGLTSVFGLSVNLLGAEANVMVGEIQMFIEAVAKEFFDFEDWTIADLWYTEMLPEYLAELGSFNKKSKLALLGDEFNVMEDYYETLRQNGFNKSLIGRIMSDPNLMFLYGAGEHLLHNQTMLAILHSVKVYDTQTNTEVPLFNIFDVRTNGKNGVLEQNRERYKWIIRDTTEAKKRVWDKGKRVGTRDITDDDIAGVEKQIAYCNKSMHGAFSAIDRGTVHRYAIGRLFMNFRQWMPAHYARRFNKTHRDADLGEYRRGFYNSLFSFLGGAVAALYKNKTTIGASWNALPDMDKFNLRRAMAEVTALLTLSVSMIPMGTYKDKKGNWAYRNLMYQMRRMLMEVQASTPVFIPFLTNPMGMVDNIMTILNSPFAALNTIELMANTLNVLDLFDRIEGGKYDGENRWIHNLKRDFPFIGQISKQYHLKDTDDLFKVFDRHF